MFEEKIGEIVIGLIYPLIYSVFFFVLSKAEGHNFEIDKMGKTFIIGIIIHLVALALKADPYSLATLSSEAVITTLIDRTINKLGTKPMTEEEKKNLIKLIAFGAGVTPEEFSQLSFEALLALVGKKVAEHMTPSEPGG